MITSQTIRLNTDFDLSCHGAATTAHTHFIENPEKQINLL
jgi:hypothetical protein